jgi:uracil-DNA glycosylase
MTDLPHPIVGGSFSSPVKPDTGWPADLATSETKVAKNQSQVKNIAKSCNSLTELGAAISVCSACPGLVKWRTEVAVNKRKSFEDQPYWGRPAAGFGALDPALLVVGLAPAANGANRTGRIFTGDRSGDWLYRAMHKAGFATQPTSEHAGDGLELINARVLAAVRCAPPNNKPTPVERDICAHWFAAELEYLLPRLKVIVALGSFAWDQTQALLLERGLAAKKTKFGHGAIVEYQAADSLLLIGSYHVSQQNTFTGRLTEAMIDQIFTQASQRITSK